MQHLWIALCLVSATAAAEPARQAPQKHIVAERPIDCFTQNLTPQEGIACLQMIRERRNFEATLKALQR
jgi:hypothetical protein